MGRTPTAGLIEEPVAGVSSASDVIPADTLDFYRRVLHGLLERDILGDADVCRGTLLSRLQYLKDIRERGYRDARLCPEGAMTQDQIDAWSLRGEQEAAAAMPAHLQPKKPKTRTRRSP